MKKYKFRLAAYTDSAGKTNPEAPRNGNEDNMFVCADLSSRNQETLFSIDTEETLSKGGCLLVVADGMGGMNAGEVASEIAVDVVKESFSPDTIQPEVFEDTETRTHFLESVVVRADSAIKKHAELHPECEGMGSTIVMVWLYDGQATVTWCGDSRAYLYRPNIGLKQVSKDHSYVQDLVDEGKITMDEAFDHPYNNVITRSLGDPAHKARPDSVTIPVFRGDIIMVNSDGLSGVLRDAEMERIISENSQSMSSCRSALWAAAERADWYDNVTAILCEITEGAEYNPAMEGIEDKDLNKSFFNLRISKKAIKWGSLAALLVIVLAGVLFKLLPSPPLEYYPLPPVVDSIQVDDPAFIERDGEQNPRTPAYESSLPHDEEKSKPSISKRTEAENLKASAIENVVPKDTTSGRRNGHTLTLASDTASSPGSRHEPDTTHANR